MEQRATCPFRAQAIDDGVVKDVNRHSDCGIEGHRILADGLEQAEGNMDFDIVEYIRDEARKARPDVQPQVVEALGRLGYDLRRTSAQRIIGIEKQYSTVFLKGTHERGPVVCSQCLDLVAAGRERDTLVVTDWKTGWKDMTNAQAQSAFQTRFGCWLLMREIPEVQTIHWFYAQTRHGHPAYALIKREDDFFNIEGQVQTVVQLFLSDCRDAWPDPDKCCTCPATAICPHVIGEAKELMDDPQKYLLQYAALKEGRLDKMEKAMKAYVAEHGTIEVDGTWFGYKQPARRVAYGLHTDKDDKSLDQKKGNRAGR